MKKILLSIALVFGLTLSGYAQQDWNAEYEAAQAPVVHKANLSYGTLPTNEVKNQSNTSDPDPATGTSPVGALAIPFAAMLGLYGVASLKEKEE